MASVLSSLRSLPPLTDFISPTPEVYSILLNTFQYFPVVSDSSSCLKTYNILLTKPGQYTAMASFIPSGWEDVGEELALQYPGPPRLVRDGDHRTAEPGLHSLQAASDGQYRFTATVQ